MDDLFLMSPSLSETQNLLNRAAFALSWGRMSMKASKSRSIIIENGRVKNNSKLVLSEAGNENKIPSIVDNPVKFLGRQISFPLSDKSQVDKFSEALTKGLLLIDKSYHRDLHKLWILQHLLIPRLRWPLLIYEIPLTAVVKFEQKISVYIRKWLRLHNSTTNICLYSASSPCPLPLKSLSAIWKSSKVSGQLLLRDSKDPFVSKADIPLKAGKWEPKEAVNKAEQTLAFNKILGYHQSHRAGFGALSIPEVPPKQSYDYRKLLSSLVSEDDETSYQAKAVQLQLQGQWTKWCSYVKQDLSWKTLLGLPQNLVSFCLGATYDTLPSPSNLHKWNISVEKSCFLCKKPVCTTSHILGACKIALNQGRYTYRHDAVLEILVSELKSFLSSPAESKPPSKFIKFVKQGTIPKKTRKVPFGILHEASDWVLLTDLDNLVIPPFIAVSSLRPDIFLFFVSTKRVVIIELTCPCEENMENWHYTKFHKYDPLALAITKNGWFVDLFAVEVGARGYCAMTVKSCLLRLGFSAKMANKILKSLSAVSLKRSFEIWLSRESVEWPKHNITAQSPTEKNNKPTSFSNVQKKTEKPMKLNKHNLVHNKNTSKVDFQRVTSVSTCNKNCGILNKGNTCYLNASLQCLSTMVSFWSNLTMCSTSLSPFVSSFVRIMSTLRSSKSPIDPSSFIRHLQKVVLDSGKLDFNVFQQQDAAEILSCILEELCSVGPANKNMVEVSLRTTITCDKCNNENIREDSTKILQVPIKANLQSSLNTFLAPEVLESENAYFCNVCQSLESAIISYNLVAVGAYLIVQTKRFSQDGSGLVKHLQKIACNQTLSVPVISLNNSIENKKFKLLGTINHTGSLDRGHYTAFIRTPINNSWLHCNDAAVVTSVEKNLDNNSSYIYFWEMIK